MKSNKEILRFINSLRFKTKKLTNQELQSFELIKHFLIKEFRFHGLNYQHLFKLTNIIDDLHLKFIEIHPEVNNDVFDDFNKLFFKLYKQKYDLYDL